MNRVQEVFEFHAITLHPKEDDNITIPTKSIDWDYVENEITKMRRSEKPKFQNIDYWICITSEHIVDEYYFGAWRKMIDEHYQYFAIITSKGWDEYYSPPSLFEYITLSVLICSIYFINLEFHGTLDWHASTKGCIFDYTYYKPQRRILVSNPLLCPSCKNSLLELENKIRTQTKNSVGLCRDVQNLINKEWMGSLETRDSPLYNLKKNFKYNVNRNSGFYKSRIESIRDNILDNIAQWIIGSIIGGGGLIVTIIFLIFGIKT
jgi:hypothetical protein